MALACFRQPTVAFLALAPPDQELTEPEHRLCRRNVIVERRQVRSRLLRVEGMLARIAAAHPIANGVEIRRSRLSRRPRHVLRHLAGRAIHLAKSLVGS